MAISLRWNLCDKTKRPAGNSNTILGARILTTAFCAGWPWNEKIGDTFSFSSRDTRGVKSSERVGKKLNKRAGGILRYRDRISHVYLSLFRFSFVFALQNCVKSYGRGTILERKKQRRTGVVSLWIFMLSLWWSWVAENIAFSVFKETITRLEVKT